ncbi:uncharacterized protein MONOS_7691 [Monocercomonoides exilis]|uniref:uncharacterized protein n=1 Tax=Monocercomonoides exilis TaxID=2049356 RepID=UPI003559B7CB|nr:hypothetical protein MONOS_7691 [Monocercomonoides exilis]|eukprot:MONOS_7691.1-p1 / transcript=MONOS_7691.1 / gene=MONOS_7691 / organism=Monocercomonoides_exilis_PA203 / gene_product=unspecified product / transcript_product=unspecified product / location=Mono_scaffold00269:54113-55073(+) / protein_length=289 / sequence_SO=supercontig / SO=protein_coding / is_pseudo=false
MKIEIGAKGALTISLSHVVGEGGATLCVMGVKDLDKEVTKAMPDEFQDEKGKVDDEEAKITFNSLESDVQREKLLRMTKLQEIQKKKKEEEEKKKRRKTKEEKDKNLFSSIQGILQPHLEAGTPTNQKEYKMASEAQQEAKESHPPNMCESKVRKMDNFCGRCKKNLCVCSSRREADERVVGSDECAEEWAEAEQGGAAKRKGDEVEGMVAVQRGSRSDTQKGKERSRERIASAVSEGERDKNIQSEQCAWEKRCAIVLKVGTFLHLAEFNGDGSDAEIFCTQFGCAF